MAEPDRYEVLDVVGTGGMATVWRARDRQLGRVIALKRPHPAPPGSDVHARFDREARTAAAVSHPNLIEIYDVGRDADGPFLVMEFVDAPSLADERVNPDAAARVGAEIADGLAALHDAGIVHRDVKPANVLRAHGGAKLTDFGIARGLDTTTLTQPGLTHGTPAYAAPEVLADGAHSPASDVYSLATVVFEVVTGSRYAPGGVVRLDEWWRPVLEPALSPEPRDRPTAASLVTAFQGLRTRGEAAPPLTEAMTTVLRPSAPGAPVDADPNGVQRSEVRSAIVLFIALVATAGVVIFAATRGGADGDAGASPDASSEPGSDVASTAPGTPASTAPATTTAPSTSATTTSTTSSTTTSTSTSTSTTVPPDELPSTPTGTRDALIAAVDQSNLLGRGQPSEQFEEHLDEAIERWADGRESDAIEDRLKDAAKELDKRVDDDMRTELVALLTHLADQLDVDPDVVTDEFDDRDRDDD